MFPAVITRFSRVCCVLLSLAGATSLLAQDVTLTPLTIGWRDASSFKRISEYFNGQENSGDTTILRTHPEQRGGYYLFFRAENPSTPLRAKVVIHLVMPADQQPHIHTFVTELRTGKNLVNFGLTGPDWPDLKTNPVAWKIQIFTTDDRLIATGKSYLWDKPPGK